MNYLQDFSGGNPFQFCLTTEKGSTWINYSDYLEHVMERMREPKEYSYKLVLGRRIFIYRREWLDKNPPVKAAMKELEYQNQLNPLSFFSPSSQEALDFLNDNESDVKGVIAPNRTGKSTTAFIDLCLDMFPCDPDWPIFQDCGVKFRPFQGPSKVGIATYKWAHHKRVVWKEIVRHWIPDEQLGVYGKSRVTGSKNHPAWSDNPEITLKCGTEIYFFCYEQDQDMFESQAMNIWMWDEQAKEAQYDGADERVRTVEGRHVMSLTPHKIPGRPDTGAGSWIQKMFDGTQTKGRSPKSYTISIADVPDWVYPEREKEKSYKKWVEDPNKNQNLKVIREGRARFFGEWHQSSGLVYDEWDPKMHIIDEFDHKNCTIYRGLDHGTNNPTACVGLAVTSDCDIVIFKEYYQRGLTIDKNVENIIHLFGNHRKLIDQISDPRTGRMHQRWEEVYNGTKIQKSVMDSRSYASAEGSTQVEIGKIYKDCGLHVKPGSGKFSDKRVPIVKEYFAIDPDRTHIVTGEKGAPQLYVLRSCVNFIREIQGYVWDEYASGGDARNLKERPRQKDDHCFAAGTEVETSRGPVPIEQIQVGDLVLTREGYFPVRAAGLTKKSAKVMDLCLSNGEWLCGTPNHLIWVENAGWIELQHLMRLDTLCSCKERNPSRITESSTEGIQIQREDLKGCITLVAHSTARRVYEGFMRIYGKMRTVLFRKDAVFITSTITPSTTTYPTLNASTTVSICEGIWRPFQNQRSSGLESTQEGVSTKQRSGTGLKREGLGIADMLKGSGRKVARGLKSSVRFAVVSLLTNLSSKTENFAQENAKQKTDTDPALMTPLGFARGVGPSLEQTSTPESDFAPVSVLAVTARPEGLDVYDLTVDGPPEFFANGILVHNCMDAMGYILMENIRYMGAEFAYTPAKRRRRNPRTGY